MEPHDIPHCKKRSSGSSSIIKIDINFYPLPKEDGRAGRDIVQYEHVMQWDVIWWIQIQPAGNVVTFQLPAIAFATHLF